MPKRLPRAAGHARKGALARSKEAAGSWPSGRRSSQARHPSVDYSILLHAKAGCLGSGRPDLPAYSKGVSARFLHLPDDHAAPTLTYLAPTLTYLAPTLTSLAPTLTYLAPALTSLAPTLTSLAPTLTHLAPTLTHARPGGSYRELPGNPREATGLAT